MNLENLDGAAELLDFETGEKISGRYWVVYSENERVSLNDSTFWEGLWKESLENLLKGEGKKCEVEHFINGKGHCAFSIPMSVLERRFPNTYGYFSGIKC